MTAKDGAGCVAFFLQFVKLLSLFLTAVTAYCQFAALFHPSQLVHTIVDRTSEVRKKVLVF